MSIDINGTGAFYLAKTLSAHGVTRIFGLCGDHINSLYRAASLEGIEIVGTRSESGAVHMADAWARVTGQLGVVFVTGCPGHSNALTGMAVATNAGSPVLVISGFTPANQRERGGSQVMHQEDMARPVTKWALEVPDGAHISEMTGKAIRIATTGTPGAVSLSVPSDILDEPVTVGADNPSDHCRPVMRRFPAKVNALISDEVKRDIQSVLSDAKKPVIILGNGARTSGKDVQALVGRTGIPAFTIDQARGLVPDDGVVGFGYADPLFNRTFREIISADVMLLIGTGVDFHTCFGREQLLQEHVRIVQISEDERILNQCRQSEIAIVGPASALLCAAVEIIEEQALANQWKPWLVHLQDNYANARNAWADQCRELSAEQGGIHPLQLCVSLERHRTADTGIMIDAGDFVHWPRAYFPALRQGRWMDAVLIGNLGGSVPLGIGSQLAHGHGQTWVFIGDGGFAYYSWDLEVAVEKKLPLKIILGNDAAWGIEKRLQLNLYGEHVGCELRHIRYDRYAEMIGATGIYVDNVNDLDAAVDKLMAAEGPALLNVNIRSMAGRPLADFKRY